MSKVEYGSVTINSTGTKIITLADSTLQPQEVVLFVSDSSTVASAGYGNLTSKFTGGSAYNDESLASELIHYRNVSGSKTKIIEATLPANSFNNAGEYLLNVSTLYTSTQVKFVVKGI